MSMAASSLRNDALDALRRQQELARSRIGPSTPIARTDNLQAALAHASQRERSAELRGDFFSVSGMRYPARHERLRWARTREILSRSSPGPQEDGSYIEMIARQAASIEMVLRQEHTDSPNLRLQDICDRVLLGTLPTFNPTAYAHRFGDFFFVLIGAGLIDFVYQAAKAVVLSWKPVPPAPGGAYGFKCEADDVAEVLAANPLPMKLLSRTIESYLFTGVPRVESNAPPAPNYQAPLSILTNCNERFVIAHEYAHTLHDALDIVVQTDNAMHGEEFASDVMAFRWVAQSGRELDWLPPNVSTQGAFFVLTALDVIRQAQDLARFGEVRADLGLTGHPPTAQRLHVLHDCYLQTVTRQDDDLSIRATLFPARTLELLWKRIVDDGVAAAWHGRTLSPIWNGM